MLFSLNVEDLQVKIASERMCVLAVILAWTLVAVPVGADCSLEKKVVDQKQPPIYCLENDFLRVEIAPQRAGGIRRVFYKPTKTELNIPPEQVGGDPSLMDRIYRHVPERDITVIEVEYFGRYPAVTEVVKNTTEEVSVRTSVTAASPSFQGLVVHKTYTLRRNSSALVLDHVLENSSSEPLKAGIWAQTYFRSSGLFAERNTYFSPASDGLRVITHPGKSATEQGDWVLEPAAGWHAVLGNSSRTGLVGVFDLQYLSCYYDWYSKGQLASTFEWIVRQQDIPAKQAFRTSYHFIPVQDFKRVDGVVAGRFPVGISLPKTRFNPGDAVEFDVRA
ncbi:MAG: hypothetical protein FJ278_23670, partial [Planctomycetes bacterium]|nr:hypothetical protein [Planctomycetota bacterium]